MTAEADTTIEDQDEDAYERWVVEIDRHRSVDLDEEDDPEAGLWWATLAHYDVHDNREPTATASFYVFRGARSIPDLFERCDIVSADLSHVASAITIRSGGLARRFYSGILGGAIDLIVVDRLEVRADSRGNGHGETLLRIALKELLGKHRALVVTYPAPLMEIEERTLADWTRVRNFWERLGFTHIGLGVAAAPYGWGDLWETDSEWANEWRRRLRRRWPTE